MPIKSIGDYVGIIYFQTFSNPALTTVNGGADSDFRIYIDDDY